MYVVFESTSLHVVFPRGGRTSIPNLMAGGYDRTLRISSYRLLENVDYFLVIWMGTSILSAGTLRLCRPGHKTLTIP